MTYPGFQILVPRVVDRDYFLFKESKIFALSQDPKLEIIERVMNNLIMTVGALKFCVRLPAKPFACRFACDLPMNSKR